MVNIHSKHGQASRRQYEYRRVVSRTRVAMLQGDHERYAFMHEA